MGNDIPDSDEPRTFEQILARLRELEEIERASRERMLAIINEMRETLDRSTKRMRSLL